MIKLGRLRFFDESVEMTTRVGGGYDSSGRWVEGGTTIVEIVGNIQPYLLSGKDTFVAPDGLIAEDAKMLWTQATVKTVDQYNLTTGLSEADSFFLSPTQEYVAFQLHNYTHTQMTLYHHQVLLLRRKQA